MSLINMHSENAEYEPIQGAKPELILYDKNEEVNVFTHILFTYKIRTVL